MPTLIQFLGLLFGIAITAWVVRPLRPSNPRLFYAMALVIPAMGLVMYQLLGAPVTLDPDAAPRPKAEAASNARPPRPDDPQFAEAVTQLKAELARDPQQPEGWALLARSQVAQGDFSAAKASFANAIALLPDDPVLLLEAAQASAQATAGNRFDDAALAMLQRAVALQPDNQRAGWFIGVAQRQRGANAEAARTWEALLPSLDPATATSLRQQIDAARAAAGMPPLPAAAPATAQSPSAPTAPTAAPAGAHALTIHLQVDPALRQRMGQATVFVLARVPGASPMPVAVQRHTLDSLPATITLGDADSPMPTRALSALAEVEVLARISRSGRATRGDGDIDTAPIRLKLPAAAPVTLHLQSP